MGRTTRILLAGLDRVKGVEAPLRRWVLPDRFHRVEVETSSRCNRTCHYCPVATDPRAEHRMEETLFESILDQLAELRFTGRFSPHFYGEPLLDPRLPAWLARAHERLPRARIVVYTNGDALTPKTARALVDAGVDLVLLTLEAGEPKAWKDTQASLPRAVLRRRFLVRHFDESVPRPFNRGGAVRFPGRETHLSSCILPASTLVVDAWGKVKLCANDYFGQEDWGDLHHDRIADLWARPAYVKLRRDLLFGRFEKPICRVCTGRAAAPGAVA
jgi:cyclic pyranopterin phosphate synthase